MVAPVGSREAALIPTGCKMKSYACMRSLGRRGVHTVVASEYDEIPHFASRFCSEAARLPASPDEDLGAYTDALLSLAARPDVETVYPVRECDVFVLSKHREAFEEHVSLVVPPFESLRQAHDRLRLAEVAREAGVAYPETRLLSEVDDWGEDLVVKSRYNALASDYVEGYPSDRLAEVKDVRFLPAGDRPDERAVRTAMGHDPVVQEFVPQADKHLYTALWDHGEPLSTYQHRQLRQNSWVGGGGVYRESVHSEAVEQAAYDLLSELEWHGFACIEYLEDADTGEWTFIEVNPRLWQSAPEAVRAGVDFPYHYWRRARGEPGPIDATYEAGQRCHNAYGELAHLLSVLRDDSPFVERPSFVRTFAAIATSCVTNPRFEYVRRDDPGLFVAAVREALSGGGVSSSREYGSGSGGDGTGDDGDATADDAADPAAADRVPDAGLSDVGNPSAATVRAEVGVDDPRNCPVAAASRGDRQVESVSRTTASTADGDVVTETVEVDGELPVVPQALSETGEGTYRFSRPAGRDCVCDAVEGLGCPVTDVRASEGTLVVGFTGPAARVRAVVDELADRFADVSVREVVPLDGDAAV